ncbi:hypothetical protein [Pseudoalteromonas luteoviolacea]|uniref:hypothetical protein n=1 Tax=Pseudoalteromonas luteoviolacea TaxID=43657 RepID=UPI00163BDEFE
MLSRAKAWIKPEIELTPEQRIKALEKGLAETKIKAAFLTPNQNGEYLGFDI